MEVTAPYRHGEDWRCRTAAAGNVAGSRSLDRVAFRSKCRSYSGAM